MGVCVWECVCVVVVHMHVEARGFRYSALSISALIISDLEFANGQKFQRSSYLHLPQYIGLQSWVDRYVIRLLALWFNLYFLCWCRKYIFLSITRWYSFCLCSGFHNYYWASNIFRDPSVGHCYFHRHEEAWLGLFMLFWSAFHEATPVTYLAKQMWAWCLLTSKFSVAL